MTPERQLKWKNLFLGSLFLCALSTVVMFLVIGNLPFFPYVVIVFPSLFLGIAIGLIITRKGEKLLELEEMEVGQNG